MVRKIRAVTVDGLVVKEDKILLVKRSHPPYQDFWAIPGGYVEFGETCEEATIREVEEETGLKTKIKTLIGVYSKPQRHPQQAISVAYLLEIIGGKVKKSQEAKEIGWFSLYSLPPLGFDHAKIIADWQKKFSSPIEQVTNSSSWKFKKFRLRSF